MRHDVKIIKADAAFVIKLEQIKAQRLLNGNPIKSTAKLMNEMLHSENFKKLEDELIHADKKKMLNINIRMDGFFR